MKHKGGVRLYRGLKKKYNPEEVGTNNVGGWFGADFTDCPYRALQFARGARGVVLVLDLPEEAFRFPNFVGIRVSEELWSFDGLGRFDHVLAAEIPAKQLRTQIRARGITNQTEEDKSRLLKRYIEEQ